MNEVNQEQMAELQKQLDAAEPIPISMTMTKESFKFIVKQLRIADEEKYRIDNGITIASKNSSLFKFQARVNMSDGSSKLISLREEK